VDVNFLLNFHPEMAVDLERAAAESGQQEKIRDICTFIPQI